MKFFDGVMPQIAGANEISKGRVSPSDVVLTRLVCA
jgi:hypothetical protein